MEIWGYSVKDNRLHDPLIREDSNNCQMQFDNVPNGMAELNTTNVTKMVLSAAPNGETGEFDDDDDHCEAISDVNWNWRCSRAAAVSVSMCVSFLQFD